MRLGIGSAAAQNAYGEVGSGCNAAPSPSLTAGQPVPLPIDPATGALCTRNAPNSAPYVPQGSLLLTTSVLTTSTQLTNASAAAHVLTICTLPTATANVWLNENGGPAVVNQGLPVFAYGGCTPINPAPTGAVYGISDGASPVTISAGGS